MKPTTTILLHRWIAAMSGILIVGTILVNAYRDVVLRAYDVQLEATCEEGQVGCFAYECDAEEIDDCELVGDTYYGYYSIVVRSAASMPECTETERCDFTVCDGDDTCEVLVCDPESRSDEELCQSELPYEA